MLERVVARLNRRGCIFSNVRTASLSSNRMLHSTFWIHGGESLLQDYCADTHDETETVQDTIISKIRSITAALSGSIEQFSKPSIHSDTSNLPQPETLPTVSALGLDFLYPPKALALLQRLSVTGTLRRPHKGTSYARLYSSFIADTAKDRRDARQRARDNDPTWDYAPSGMSEGLFDKRLKGSKNKWVPEEDERRLQAMNPRDFDFSERSFDLAWDWYFDVPDAPQQPRLYLASNRTKRTLLLGYMNHSTRRIDHERVIALLEDLDPPDRYLPDWRYLVRAYLHLDESALALKTLTDLVDQDIGTWHAGFEEFMAYCIRHDMWDRALRAWQLLQADHPGKQTVMKMKLVPRYGAVEAQYTIKAVENFPQKFATWISNQLTSDSETRDFAIWLAAAVEREAAIGSTSKFSRADLDIITDAMKKKDWHEGDLVDLEYKIVSKLFSGNHDEVIKDYHQYRDHPKARPSNILLNRVLVATIELSDFKTMQSVFDDYFTFHNYPAARAYRAILGVFAKRGESRVVEELFQQFSTRFNPAPEDYVHIIRAYVERGEVATAVEKLEAMSELNLEPDILCYNTLLRGFAKAEDMDGAMEYLNIILSKGLVPDHSTYGSLMYVCAARGDFENVDLLFRAAGKSMKPSATMWSMVVWAHVNGGARSLAWKLIHFLYRQNLGFPLTHAYNMLMSAYANQKELATVGKIFNQMQQRQVPFDIFSYTIMMRALVQTQSKYNLQRARQMLDLLMTQEVQTSAVPYFVLMQGYLRRRKYAEVFAIYTNMLENNIEPNFGVQSMLLLASIFEAQELGRYTGNVDLKYAEEISRIAIEKFSGFDPTSFSAVKTAIPTNVFTPLISSYIYKENYDAVRTTYERFLEIAAKGGANKIKPSMNMYLKLLHAAQREKNWSGLREIWDSIYKVAQKRSRPLAEISTGKNVVTFMKREMCPAFDVMLKAAIETIKDQDADGIMLTEISTMMENIISWGFELDGGNWNSLIVLVALSGDMKQAFTLAEKQLVRDEAYDFQIAAQRRFGFVGFAKHAQHPHINTLDVLAEQLNGMIVEARESNEAGNAVNNSLKYMAQHAPMMWKLCNIRRRDTGKRMDSEFKQKIIDFARIAEMGRPNVPKMSHTYNLSRFEVKRDRFLAQSEAREPETKFLRSQKARRADPQLGDFDFDLQALDRELDRDLFQNPNPDSKLNKYGDDD
ncbi:hypothetical protein TWF694_011702 [Orbilia ellipsospora]|uniref:Pentatricopeptide repeat protein n=1 Tax=Orbilia ellipsospora TaxID=2528407 RepID=A0AAV9X607_9PEZI